MLDNLLKLIKNADEKFKFVSTTDKVSVGGSHKSGGYYGESSSYLMEASYTVPRSKKVDYDNTSNNLQFIKDNCDERLKQFIQRDEDVNKAVSLLRAISGKMYSMYEIHEIENDPIMLYTLGAYDSISQAKKACEIWNNWVTAEKQFFGYSDGNRVINERLMNI